MRCLSKHEKVRIARDLRIAGQHLLVFVAGTEVDLHHHEVILKLLSEVGILLPEGVQTVAPNTPLPAEFQLDPHAAACRLGHGGGDVLRRVARGNEGGAQHD